MAAVCPSDCSCPNEACRVGCGCPEESEGSTSIGFIIGMLAVCIVGVAALVVLIIKLTRSDTVSAATTQTDSKGTCDKTAEQINKVWVDHSAEQINNDVTKAVEINL